MLTVMYLVLAALGVGYVLLSAVFGHIADAFDGGDGHGDGHHGDAHGVAAFHFPFFSPLALSTLFGALGAWGLIMKHGFRLADAASLLTAIPLAIATGYAVTYAAWRMVSGSRGSISIRLSDLVGATAEVLTPIPAGGMGEIAALVDGQRFARPARESQGREVPRGAQVKVVQVVGGTLLVTIADGRGGVSQ
jgi:membrane protein implicated in regulation of membrane protease activity